MTRTPDLRITKQFRLSARARSNALIRPGETLAINYNLDGRDITLNFRTRYLQQGFTSPIPGDFWLDAAGQSTGIEASAAEFTNGARDIAAMIAVSANAYIGPLEPEIIYEITPGLTERPYYQRFVPADQVTYSSRFVDLDAALALIAGIAASEHRDRLIRAVSQYSEALSHWRKGHEVLALSHLFMGVEALKKAMWRREAKTLGLSREQLAEKWGYDPKKSADMETHLDREARQRLIFKGKIKLHQLAKKTSDSFEHGFLNAGKLYEPARRSLVGTGACLRAAILELADVPSAAQEVMHGKRFARPAGPPGIEQQIWATLAGPDGEFAASGTTYPMFQWQYELKDIKYDELEGAHSFTPHYTFTGSLSEAHTFKDMKSEVYDVGHFMPDGVEEE